MVAQGLVLLPHMLNQVQSWSWICLCGVCIFSQWSHGYPPRCFGFLPHLKLVLIVRWNILCKIAPRIVEQLENQGGVDEWKQLIAGNGCGNRIDGIALRAVTDYIGCSNVARDIFDCTPAMNVYLFVIINTSSVYFLHMRSALAQLHWTCKHLLCA